MIIKSHIRGGYRSAANYLKTQGENEHIRTVEISDPGAATLDDAFHNIWAIASQSRVKKALHHISINPFKDERLTDAQVLRIVERCEQKYGYKPGTHQRVIVEHIKGGRQHFHVMWNRVSLMTGKAVWPGHHWKKSKQIAREMEQELGLKRPIPKRMKPPAYASRGAKSKRPERTAGRYDTLNPIKAGTFNKRIIKSPHIKAAKDALSQPVAPRRPANSTKGWPEAAILDWATWGHRNPPRFFALWPELST